MKKIYLIIIIILALYILLNIAAMGISLYSPNSLHIPSGIVDQPISMTICSLSIVCAVENKNIEFGDTPGYGLKKIVPICACIFNR